jgi:hypothetical protein
LTLGSSPDLSRSHARIVFRHFRSGILCSTRDLQLFFGQRCHRHYSRLASQRDRGGYRHLTDVSSLSPATGWYSSFALLMRYSNSRPLWKSCFSLPRRRRLDRSNVDISPTWNLCGAGSPGSAVQRVHLGTTLRHAGEPETPLTSWTSVILDSSLQFLLGPAPEERLRDLQRHFRAVSARQDRAIKLRG